MAALSRVNITTAKPTEELESVLTAIAGYSKYDFERYLDADLKPLPIVRFDDTEDFEQKSLEVRLASDLSAVAAGDYAAALAAPRRHMLKSLWK